MYKLPVETVNQILEYLNRRPFGEVADLVVAIRQQGELDENHQTEEKPKENKKK